jgi:hypothetical protein
MIFELIICSIILIVVLLTYRIKKPVLHWLFIIVPPLFVVPFYWINLDIGAVGFWICAGIAFLWSIISLIVNLLRIIIRKLRKKTQIEFCKIRFLRPILTIIIFLLVAFFVHQSRVSADKYGIETAKKIQDVADSNGICPKKIQDWEADKWDPNDSITMYGKYGTKYRLRYHTSEDRKEFVISVRHNIDEYFHVSGGVDRKLKDTYSGPSNTVYLPIE